MNNNTLSPGILIGHSMGGKAVMETALRHPEIVDKLVVVDVSPVTYTGEMRQAFRVLKAMAAMPLDAVGDRRGADRWLSEKIPEPAVRGFVLQNLVADEQSRLSWRVNIPAMIDNMGHLAEFPDHTQPYEGDTLFIRGSRVRTPENEIRRCR